ncbi:MAG: hypothetical protein JKY56_17640 [Kofleriaceae bacterium]|nr:hypothetical protein [Kofleriaceae bacterium]
MLKLVGILSGFFSANVVGFFAGDDDSEEVWDLTLLNAASEPTPLWA